MVPGPGSSPKLLACCAGTLDVGLPAHRQAATVLSPVGYRAGGAGILVIKVLPAPLLAASTGEKAPGILSLCFQPL